MAMGAMGAIGAMGTVLGRHVIRSLFLSDRTWIRSSLQFPVALCFMGTKFARGSLEL